MDNAEDDKGLEEQHFTQMATSNLIWFQYAEWSSMRDFVDHMDSKHFEKFYDHIDDSGIKWSFEPLINESEDIEEHQQLSTSAALGRSKGKGRGRSSRGRGRGKGEQPEQPEQDEQDEYAYDYDKWIPGGRDRLERGGGKHKHEEDVEDAHNILVVYDVPPQLHGDFIDAWRDVAESTVEEKGNIHYKLRHSMNTNTRFYTCGAWETLDDFMDHFESKHTGRFLDFVDKHDVVWFLAPVKHLRAMEHRSGTNTKN